jgi:ubiquitin carboxyl-terminal hydrolase 48
MKRYEFKIEKAIIKKILATMEYPLEINLGFLMKTPPEIDCEYQLFAVTVHRGTTYNSGHYYSYINTSSDLNHPAWY